MAQQNIDDMVGSGSTYSKHENIKIHTNQIGIKCLICEKHFSKTYLREHIERHHGNREFQCNLCNKSFFRRNQLRLHLKCHNEGPRLHACLICEKRFLRRDTLQNHLKLHTSNDKFRCTQCQKTYPTKAKLKLHILSHTQKFSCPSCKMCFREKGHLKTHLNMVHEKKRFDCDICQKR